MIDTGIRHTRAAGIVVFLAVAHFSHHVLTAVLIPLLPFIRDAFALTYAQSGLVTSVFTIAYGIGQLPGGWLADRAGPRFLLLAGISGIAVVGALIGVSTGYATLLVLLFILGFLGGGYHPAASLVISRSVSPSRRGPALGFHIIGGSASHFLAPLLAAGLAAAVGWRATYPILAAPVFVLGIGIFIILHRKRAEPAHARMSANDAPEPAESPRPPVEIALFLILAGLVSAGAGSLIALLPLYFVDVRAMAEPVAAAMLSIIYSAGFVAAPLGGWLSDRLGRVRVMIVLGLLTGPFFFALIVVPSGVPLVALLLIIGVIMFVKMPTAEAFIASAVPGRIRATVLGIYFFTGVEVGAILTPAIGRIVDLHGFATGFRTTGLVLTGVAVAAAGILVVLWMRQRRSVG